MNSKTSLNSSTSRRFYSRAILAAFTLALLLISGTALGSDGNEFSDAVAKGPIYAAVVALLGGLLVSLTPCVYPMIAITVSVFGARQTTSKLQGFGLSSAFVLGIISMFTPLGVVAGMTGSLFGSVLQNPWVHTGIAILFVAMAASMLGAFELALPSALTNRLAAVGGVGPKGAFGLGLVCGLIAAPCTGPVLTGILTWIAKTQSAFAGGSAMFAFSLGLGLPFLVVGTFAVQLPKSGPWMIHIKSLLAIILSVVALYFFGNAFPAIHAWIEPGTMTLVIAGALVLVGFAAGALHRDFGSPNWNDKILKGFGVAVTTLAAYVIVVSAFSPERELEWQRVPFEQAAISAQESKMPMLVDFTATWCGACKELDRETFADAEVSREAGRFLAVKVDATDDEDPVVAKTMKRLNVVGLPTVLLFSAEGKEVKRFTDFVEAETFLAALKQVH